jgi:hypothetical protein
MEMITESKKKQATNTAKKYKDQRGWKYQVMGGIGGGTFKARYQKPEKHGSDGWKCLSAVPWRADAAQAQADLDRLAKERGWTEWDG